RRPAEGRECSPHKGKERGGVRGPTRKARSPAVHAQADPTLFAGEYPRRPAPRAREQRKALPQDPARCARRTVGGVREPLSTAPPPSPLKKEKKKPGPHPSKSDCPSAPTLRGHRPEDPKATVANARGISPYPPHIPPSLANPFSNWRSVLSL